MKGYRILLISALLFLIVWAFSVHRWTYNTGGNAIFSYDACGYYSYLPAWFMDDIFHPEKTKQSITEHNLYAGKLPMHTSHRTGKTVMRYPMGEAIAFLPAFALGYLIDPGGDGFGLSYSYSIGFWAILIALFGLYLLFVLLRRYFSFPMVAVLMATYILGTNYLEYATVNLLLPHSLLFTMYAGLTLLADKAYKKDKLNKWDFLWMGILCGWMGITRPTDALAILVPLYWGVSSFKELKIRSRMWSKKIPVLLMLTLGVIAAVSIQMFYWKMATDKWIYNSYLQELNFSFSKPHLYDYLFSYRKGWFVYTPIMIFSIVGLVWTLRDKKYSALMITMFLVLTLYILSSWEIWWYGGSFSQRSIVQSYVLLAFPMCYFMQIAKRQKWSRVLYGVVLLILCYTNINLHYQADHSDHYELEVMNRQYFWKTLWKWSGEPSDRRFLDLKYEMPEEYEKDLRLIYQEDFDELIPIGDSTNKYYEGKDNSNIDKIVELKISDESQWVRASARIYLPEINWNPWSLFEMKLSQCDIQDGPSQTLKPQRFIKEEEQWVEVHWDLEIERDQCKKIFLSFSNKSPEVPIFIDEIRIWKYEEPTQ